VEKTQQAQILLTKEHMILILLKEGIVMQVEEEDELIYLMKLMIGYL